MIGNGFIYQIISTVVQSMHTVLMVVCLDRLLTAREGRVSKSKRILLCSITGSLLVCVKCMSPIPGVLASVISMSGWTLYYILLLSYFYSDKAWIKLVHASMLLLQGAMSELIMAVIFGEIKNVEMMGRWQSQFANPYLAERVTRVTMLAILFNIVYTVVVLKRQKKRKISSVWVAVITQLLLILIGIWTIREISNVNFDQYFMLVCILAVLEFSLAVLYFSQSEKQEAKAEAARLQEIIEAEKVHYQELEERREEMAKLRHDYNNILTSVMFLTKNGNTDEAAGVIRALKERIESVEE
ncbi:MAG TPA: hypothetical protein DCZ20_11325 [Lachnospiraceae bacterium]|nr:hypothetical protein [Lachnospiraceae bacterium]